MSRQPAHTQQICLDRGHPRRAARAHKARHRGRVADVGERNLGRLIPHTFYQFPQLLPARRQSGFFERVDCELVCVVPETVIVCHGAQEPCGCFRIQHPVAISYVNELQEGHPRLVVGGETEYRQRF